MPALHSMLAVWLILVTGGGSAAVAARPDLLFREDFAETPAETPITPAHLVNRQLRLSLHGPAAEQIKKSHHDEIPGDPWYVWSGSCEQRWAISLRHRETLLDLTGEAFFKWRTRQSGAHVLRVVLELDDGNWIVSREGFGETPDWHVFEQPFAGLTWQELEIQSVSGGRRVPSPDLRRVRSVGWTDLSRGEGSPGCTRVDWIEVHGRTLN